MGVWGALARLQSTNWKEARTVLEGLRKEIGTGRLRGCVVFYIMDNLVSYYVINDGTSRKPSLHKLAREIKDLAFELGCHLEVVHASGTLVIEPYRDMCLIKLSSVRPNPVVYCC